MLQDAQVRGAAGMDGDAGDELPKRRLANRLAGQSAGTDRTTRAVQA